MITGSSVTEIWTNSSTDLIPSLKPNVIAQVWAWLAFDFIQRLFKQSAESARGNLLPIFKFGIIAQAVLEK